MYSGAPGVPGVAAMLPVKIRGWGARQDPESVTPPLLAMVELDVKGSLKIQGTATHRIVIQMINIMALMVS